MATKKCSRCKNVRHVSEFSRKASASDGLNYQCRTCAKSDWHGWYKTTLTTRVCIDCNAEYMPIHGMQKRCDMCRTKTCPQCQKKFIPSNGRHAQVFCSLRCAGLFDVAGTERLIRCRGTKPRKPLDLMAKRKYTAYDREWSLIIFKRDNYTCSKCKRRGGRLEAHHIKSVAAYPELRFHLSNGITLCQKCHKKTANYGPKARFEKQQRRLRQGVLDFNGDAVG